MLSVFFFFNDTATTEIYTLSLHDALPIWSHRSRDHCSAVMRSRRKPTSASLVFCVSASRSEEHTSELQSQSNLVCRLLLEKKKKNRRSRLACPQDSRGCIYSAVLISTIRH